MMTVNSVIDWTDADLRFWHDRRRSLTTVAVMSVVIAIITTIPVLSDVWRRALDDVAQAAAALVVMVACWRAHSRYSGRARVGWTALGSGVAMWFLGQIYWIAIEVVLHRRVPSPSIADIGFIAAIPLEAVGLLLISFPSSRPIARLRTALDGVLIVSSLWLSAYLLVFKELLTGSHAPSLATGVSLVYPVGDVILVTILLLALSQAGPLLRRSLILAVAAFSLLTLSDCFFAVMTVAGHYQTGRIFDMGWTTGWLLLAATIGTTVCDERSTGVESRGQAVIPYAILSFSAFVAAAYFILDGRLDAVIIWSSITIFAVAMAGLVVQREHARQSEIWRHHAASHDPLTGLPNYLELTREIEQLLDEPLPFGLLICDVDRLDAVNSSLGRLAGDRLLNDVAARVSSAVTAGCSVSRCGGDEFAVVCEGASSNLLLSLAQQITDAFETPFIIQGYEHAVNITVGIVERGSHRDADHIIREGQSSMLSAKAGNRGGIAELMKTYTTPWTLDDLELEDDLRKAIRSGEGLFPVFQPIVRLSDRSVVGLESLVRWRHPQRGLLHPGQFIGLAERTGLIVPLGWWMLDQACKTFAASGMDCWLAVNVAGSQLGKGMLVPAVLRTLQESGLQPWQLHIEITESQLVEPSPSLLEELSSLHTIGIPVALDDFGTGYSSVALLRDLNIHTIKIDMSFTRHIVTRPRVAALVRGLVEFCRQLEVDVVAEGVETSEQESLLRQFGCPNAQGYLYARPSTIDEVTESIGSTKELSDVTTIATS